MIVLGFQVLLLNCDLLFLHAPCVRHTYKFTAWKSIPRLKSDWCIFHGKLSCTSSLQLKSFHISLLLKQTCVFVKIKMATEVKGSQQWEGDLIIWKLSLIYSLSGVVHRVVQRKQFTFVFRVQNVCENAVSWQRQSAASGDGSLSRCSRKNYNG